ncbi:BMC domain-containing protein [Brachyspira pilosicoli]|uniref:BMC domain-containing protein n=1 Tax=Brachyspira pilosicoli TaxID=52584 RepID=UPI003006AD0C
MEYALGMIETHGHTAAVEALDAANKASNIILPSMVHVGSGRVAISFFGDVAAVKVAVDSGVAAAEKVGKVLASNVIARLDKQVLNTLFAYASNNNAVEDVNKKIKENEEKEEDKETESNTEIINENADNISSDSNVDNNEDALLFDEDMNKKTNNEIDSNRTVSKKKSKKKKKNDK